VPVVKGIEPPAQLFEVDQTKIVGLTIDAERLQEIRKQRARRLGGNQRAYAELLEIYSELEEAESLHRRLGLPGDRDLRPLDRGDGRSGDQARRAASRRGRQQGEDAGLTAKGRVPLWRWALWLLLLGAADVVFYVLLTPVWMGLRVLAWLADFRARRRPGYRPPVKES
jgi:hypothetical protein